jgi:hypothetical protein
MFRIHQGKIAAVESFSSGGVMKMVSMIVDLSRHRWYVVGTSLLSVSTAGRRAVSSETALAFFAEHCIWPTFTADLHGARLLLEAFFGRGHSRQPAAAFFSGIRVLGSGTLFSIAS